MIILDPVVLTPILGVLAGCVLGFAARATHFCTLSALERHWYAGDSSSLRTWVLASVSALIGTQILAAFGLADTHASFYLASAFPWTGAIIGGVMFGIGMALVGTCGFGAVLRLGGGSLRALVVLTVIGLSALAAQRGIVGVLRVPLVDDLAISFANSGSQSMGDIVSSLFGLDLTGVVAAVIALTGLFWIFKSTSYRKQITKIGAAVIIGSVITFGWWATTFVAERSFDPVQIEAGSFVVPVGDTIMQLITYTGTWPDYGVGLIIGTLVGAVVAALWNRDIRWEACDDARELGRHLLGGTLMGVGGVFSMGCTVGQGITGFSALAISAPVVMLSMAFGARVGLAWLMEGSVLAAFRRSDGVRPTAAE
ncbi:YeeE/YedE family protein [Roseibium sediminicola]|uniref:YeeE/YedE family protein n=1 Tax=Roseibium sediminicola TaxID=2933272 RepID=A0ABT0H106_9HYPH|nr:YeeE/YedE family protein [Roseibium sp. CAU 1639]MCK7615351.1 YeeE/YedE family protein [Roseibium sp. CAU 1639]